MYAGCEIELREALEAFDSSGKVLAPASRGSSAVAMSKALPVRRFTFTYGIPVGESKAGSMRRPRSSASASRRGSRVIWCAERSQPRTRMTISKCFTSRS